MLPLTPVSEWPERGLDIAALRASGWRPTPFDQFVVKVHSRCNLACDYCYMYELADQSWRDQPVVMTPEIARATARRIAEHVERHELTAVEVVFHGGEPLLAGPDRIDTLAREFRAAVDSSVHVELGVQTNGALLTPPMLDVLAAHDIGVGVSLDGDRAANDRHRRNRRGDSSYDAVTRGLRLLGTDRYRHLFDGILAVIDLANDPVETYTALAEFEPRGIDVLLPHGTWAAPPPGKAGPNGEVDITDTSYASWLVTLFDHWYELGDSAVDIRLFRSAVRQLLGRNGTTEQLSAGPLSFLVVETDGSIEQVDTLKSAFEGATATGLHVLRDDFDAAFDHPGVAARQIGTAALCDECRACRHAGVCGGGLYAQRYRPGTGFRNPSVYCADLMAFLDHVAARLRADLIAARKG
ncbi:FxsB family radical SAM/SPASM domain protein [Nocardia stercoris]|uniref:FxsB family radical SAM/SPASM domain protein n=1 Tax=Nocardia stercoris TaxID=2483361 RepID=A0A3M2L131_9NOCA|nr:FxsB family radical SAM/SPASM domain protein [Nocardia stercoris]